MSWINTKRSLLAILIAPLVAPILYQLGLLIFVYDAIPDINTFIFEAFMPLLVITLPASYAAMVFIGLPLIWFLKRNDIFSSTSLIICGATCGIIVMAYIYGPRAWYGARWIEYIWYLLFGCFLGLSVAIVYWRIANITTDSKYPVMHSSTGNHRMGKRLFISQLSFKSIGRGFIFFGIAYFVHYELVVLLYDYGSPHHPLSKALIITSMLTAYLLPGYVAGVVSKRFGILHGAVVGLVSPIVLVLHKLLGFRVLDLLPFSLFEIAISGIPTGLILCSIGGLVGIYSIK